MQSFILTISCKDKPGIVAKVTRFLFDKGFNILESGQFNDKDTNNFFMRTEFHKHENDLDIAIHDFKTRERRFGKLAK